MVTAPSIEQAGSADAHALQMLKWLQEAATYVRKQTQRMKRYYYGESGSSHHFSDVPPRAPPYGVQLCRTTASGVRIRTVQVVRRRIAPVRRVMVGLGF